MYDFKPGDKVVCVDASSRTALTGLLKWCGLLTKGAVYTVTGVGPSPIRNHLHGTPVVWLAECENITRAGRNVGFAIDRFRKVQKRDSSLSIEAFLTIKPGFEEKDAFPVKKRERV